MANGGNYNKEIPCIATDIHKVQTENYDLGKKGQRRHLPSMGSFEQGVYIPWEEYKKFPMFILCLSQSQVQELLDHRSQNILSCKGCARVMESHS